MYMPEEYVNASSMQYIDAKDILEEFENELSNMKGKCIDIGCGPGTVTAELILRRLAPEAELVGADISQSMVDYAERKYCDEKRLSFIQLNIESDYLPKKLIGQFSNALSFYCFHWCQDIRLTFENMYKLLKPGGKTLFMFLGWNSGFDAYANLPTYPRYEQYTQDAQRYVPFFHRCKTPRTMLRQMLEDIGFEVQHCSKREKTFVYQNLESLKDHMIAVNPFVSRLPNHLKEEFKNDLGHEIAIRKIRFRNEVDNTQQEYSILDRYQLLVVYATKPTGADSRDREKGNSRVTAFEKNIL